MFSPEMLKAAQGMMANMSPEDMQRMTQMASSMDPSVMENMMKNMGGAAPGMDSSTMKEQMKRIGEMSPDELKSNMSQAQQQMGGQKQYMYNASMTLKNDGNDFIKAQQYADALKSYSKALENLKPFSGEDISQLRLSLLLNSAMCYLKQKQPEKTLEVCEQALQINGKSVKALFRRGLARVDLGQLAEGVADMKLAAKLSPEDKTITTELERVEKETLGKGVSAEDIAAAEQKAAAAEAARPASSSSSASWPPAGNMEKAMEQLSSNPDMVTQATEAMKHMSPEDIDRMMKGAPLPPGVDAETARKRLEAVSKNPDMLKSAMETLQSMPEEDRKRMMAAAQGGAGAGVPDMSRMGDMLKDPEAMKSAMAAASSMGAAGSGPEADMMKKMTENPEMMDAMTSMMKNIPPEQMQKMMEMSMKMKSGGGDPKDASAMLNDPEMMKAAEEMMKSISPEALQGMAKSAGIEVSDTHAKMISRVMPYMLKLMKLWGYIKSMFQAMFSPRGRIVLAVVVLLVAVGQHYAFSGNTLLLPADTARANFSHVLVYTKSDLTEQTTPSSLAFIDTAEKASNVSFEDDDLDLGQIGGNLSWTPAEDVGPVTHYWVYLSDAFGENRSYLGSTVVGVNQIPIPPDTDVDFPAYLLVYARSKLQEQTTPAALQVVDRSASVSEVSFVDHDLDLNELGGNVSWLAPADMDRLQGYELYLSGSQLRSFASAEPGASDATLAPETPLGDFTELLVYTKSTLAEQTTPVAAELSDTLFFVAQEEFTDLDLDLTDVGGALTWLEAKDDTQVIHYNLYLGVDCVENSTLSSDVVAVLTGSVELSLAGATAQQVAAALQQALAELLQVDPSSVYVTVQVAGAGRRLATNWRADYVVVMASNQATLATNAAAQISADTTNFRITLADQLLAAGVDSNLIASTLAISSFASSLQLVAAEQLPQLLPSTTFTTTSTTNVTEDDSDEDADLSDENSTSTTSDMVVRRLSSTNTSEAEYIINILNGTRTKFITCGYRQYLGQVPVRTLAFDVPAETQLGNATHLLIYASSAVAESSVASGFVFVEDALASATNLSFIDEDLDRYELGGDISWELVPDIRDGGLGVGRVQFFSVYLKGLTRSLLGSLVNTSFELPQDTALQGFEWLTVHTVSSLAEQSTPTELLISDVDASVSALDFPDFDLDFQELGGVLSWVEPEVAEVISYAIYWAYGVVNMSDTFVCSFANSSLAEDSSDAIAIPMPMLPCRGELFAEVGVGNTNVTVPLETARKNYTHFFVYTRSSFAEQSYPAVLSIYDMNASVSGLEFDGKDLDLYELGGVLFWTPPDDVSRVELYAAYLAESSLGLNRSQIGEAPVRTDQLAISPETPRLSFTHFVVYTKSALVEQTTPTSLSIQDAAASSSNVSFLDLDLDESQVAGNLTWFEPEDISDISEYTIYMATDRLGSNRTYLGNVSAGSSTFFVEDNTPLLSFTHFLVYSRSSLVEQTTPSAVLIVDVKAAVEALGFQDLDLDAGEVGGEVSWGPPQSGLEQVSGYGVYLAADTEGTGRSKVSIEAVGTHETTVPDSTAVGSFTHVLVYSRSEVLQQSTPSSTLISDVSAQVSAVEFLDLDLDATELGGTLLWSPPDTTYIASYSAYLSSFCNGTNETEDLVYVAGTFSLSMDATPAQVEAAARVALSAVLGVEADLLSVTINLARRLSAGAAGTDFIVRYVGLPNHGSQALPMAESVLPLAAEEKDVVAAGFAELLSKELCGDCLLHLRALEGLHVEPQIIMDTQEDSNQAMRKWLLGEAATPRRLSGANPSEDSDAEGNDTSMGWDLTNYTGSAEISGSLRFSLEGAEKSQVEAAVSSALSAALNVAPAAVTSASAFLGRRLASTWTVSYQIIVALDEAQAVMSAAFAISNTPAGFASTLADALVAQGVPSASVSASFSLDFFAEPTLRRLGE
ncbi:unnamed protein product, partial [Effrenium voratum]